MPFTVRKRDCIAADGKNGSYVLLKSGKKVSCHATREDAFAAARIRIRESKDLTAEQKKRELETLGG